MGRAVKALLAIAGVVVLVLLVRALRRSPTPAVAGTGTARWPPLTPAGPAAGGGTSAPEAIPAAALEPRPWMPPHADGSCPEGYPVKAKRSSGIFHVPGGLAYQRTFPDRCYPDGAAAEADGFRAAKR